MKRYLTILITVLLSAAFVMAANEESTTVPMKQQPKTHIEDDPIGKRSPSKPVLCTLNFAEGTVELTASQEIITYEVWDADQEILIASFTESADLLNFLSNSSCCYTLCFLSEDYVYTGYYGW
ncbi:MAG: hypothetical protein NC248_04905 [Bacteroides sp.]|nr:hypothetical protein [Bacteroides sp.]MCM1388865.1 hypothetical protein [Bacteroides sp.]